jgi:hypothetical protein
VNKINFSYYYQAYRYSENTYFKISMDTIGHIVHNNQILCGHPMGEEKTFISYKIISYAIPGRSLCADCVQKRTFLTNYKRIKELDMLRRWNEAVK